MSEMKREKTKDKREKRRLNGKKKRREEKRREKREMLENALLFSFSLLFSIDFQKKKFKTVHLQNFSFLHQKKKHF